MVFHPLCKVLLHNAEQVDVVIKDLGLQQDDARQLGK